MYIPNHFKEVDPQIIRTLIEEFSFATLVTSGPHGPIATHLPIEVREETDGSLTILGHLARSNPQWETFSTHFEALCVVSGPHAYISPDWYGSSGVPTWNYQAVHLYGRPVAVHDAAGIRDIMAPLISRHHRPATPDTVHEPLDLAAETVEALMRAVVGFRISVERVEAKSKLSQNRNLEDRKTVIEQLEKAGDDNARAIAAEMRRRLED